jgi:signal transduction histidine kinase
MSASSERLRSSRAPGLAYVGFWLLLACVYMALFVSSDMPFSLVLRDTFAAILPNVILGRVSLALARRGPFTSAGRARQLAVLACSVAAVAAVATICWLALIAVDGLIFKGVAKLPKGEFIVWQAFINTLLHFVLAGAAYAWHAAEVVREADERASRSDVLRARAELQLLRSQLNPHFVLNTLHALVGLVRRDPARAESAIERLGDLLKFGQWVHQSGADFVPLSREWEFVQSYLELERLRLGERLCVTLAADEAALHVPIPPFALQPLVENAILHAVAPRASGGRIDIAARRSDGWLCLAVCDDGPGTTAAAVAASPRMGLRLLQERLAALYGGRARLTYETPASGGFRVRVDLPDGVSPESG